MENELRGRGTTAKLPPREIADVTRQADGRSTDEWLEAVVFRTAEAKVPVNIRIDTDIIRFFRAAGPGYQTRINEVLKAFVQARLRAGDPPPKPRANGHKRPK